MTQHKRGESVATPALRVRKIHRMKNKTVADRRRRAASQCASGVARICTQPYRRIASGRVSVNPCPASSRRLRIEDPRDGRLKGCAAGVRAERRQFEGSHSRPDVAPRKRRKIFCIVHFPASLKFHLALAEAGTASLEPLPPSARIRFLSRHPDVF